MLGVFTDERLTTPLKVYREQEDVFYTDAEEIYLEYVRSDLVTQPTSWPAYFWRYVAACLAESAKGQVPGLTERADQSAMDQYQRRKMDAENADFSQAPPQIIRAGNWVRARMGDGNHDGGRRSSLWS